MYTMQDVLSIRIPKELKEKMKEYPHVDWKRVIIDSIEEKIKLLEAERLLREIEEMNEKLDVSDVPAWKMIREDRNAGH